MDDYGISSAALHENEYSQQAQAAKEMNDQQRVKNKLAYSQAKSALSSNDNTSVEKIAIGQVSDYTRGVHVAQGVALAGRAAGRVGRAVARDAAPVGTVTESVPEALEGIRTGGAIGGIGPVEAPTFAKSVGADVVGQEGSAVGRTGQTFGKLEGVEGVLQQGLRVGKAGEEFAFAGTKGISNIGAVVDGLSLTENLVERGNPLKNSDGTKMSGMDIASDALTIGGGILDVASVFTGGALVPLAAAVNLAAAGVSADAGVKDIEARDKGLGDAPKQVDKIPLAQYASLGFVGSMSHDPVRSIRGS